MSTKPDSAQAGCYSLNDNRYLEYGYRGRYYPGNRAKKVVSDSPGLVDFAIGVVNSVFNLPDRQVMSFEEFE